ncbi:MAG: rhodanese-like domain-containing protein [Planctomycetota bacterium]
MTSAVSHTPAASPEAAAMHFAGRLSLETDCWDVHHAIVNGKQDFVVLDVRSEELFREGHLPTAISLPHWQIKEETLSQYPSDTLFVVYCAGPHCNGADKGALAISRLGRTVRLMIGGAIGWLDEGFKLEPSPEGKMPVG